MRFNLATFAIVFVALIIQELIQPFEWAHGAFLFIGAVAFFCCAISVPFPVMLGLAFFTGYIWDSLHVIIPTDIEYSNPKAALKDIRFGYSILLFAVLGAFMQGLRPLFRRGRWELPIILTGVGTFLFLLIHLCLCVGIR